MPQKRISICTSVSVGSRRAIVVEASGDVALAAENAFALYIDVFLRCTALRIVFIKISAPRRCRFAESSQLRRLYSLGQIGDPRYGAEIAAGPHRTSGHASR